MPEPYAQRVLTVGVLGPVEACRDGRRLPIPAGKTTELLARLAVDAPLPVRVDTIVEDLWGMPTHRNTVQAKVSQLRRGLGEPRVVRGLDGAYLLDLDPDALDATMAIRHAAAAERASARGDVETALERALAGTALFRGDVLPDAGAWATPHRVRLEEVRWGLIETAMSARVDLGGGAELVAELEALVARQPFREGLWGALITALYRSGRQDDALAAYRRVREQLAEELGIDPGPQLQSLELEILHHSTRLGGASRRPDLARPGNVTAAAWPLVGRDDDLAGVEAALDRQRLVTLVGAAGVGKTRLAVEVAARASHPGGAWLIRLEAVDSSVDVLRVIAETLRISGGHGALRDRLEGAHTLLVLDNCEHLVDRVAATVETLLDQVPRLSLLATSQLPLGLDPEHLHPVHPLPPAEARELFQQRARRHKRSFSIQPAQERLVAEVCAALDHLPLAIELAASRVRSLSLDEIAQRLDDRFTLLRDPGSHAPPRRRALEAAIAWSYHLLFPDERSTLCALSCFADGATLSALESVAVVLGVPATALADTITNLVDRSLVAMDDTAAAAPRYRLLDSIRLFAATQLEQTGNLMTAQQAHATWYAERAAWCAASIRTPRQPDCLAFARDERADIDAALAWSQEHRPSIATAIGLGMAWTWVVLGDGTAGAARIRGVLTNAATPEDRIRGLLPAVWLEASTGDLERAQGDLNKAEALAEALDDDLLNADVAWFRAFLAIQQGNASLARSAATTALDIYQRDGSTWSMAAARLLAAYGALMAGDVQSANWDAGIALREVAAVGDAWGLVHAQAIIGQVAQGAGRLDEAALAFEAAADASNRLGFAGQAALHRASLARCLARSADPHAGEAFEQALREAAVVADGRLSSSIRLHLARLLRSQGQLERAAGLLQDNVGWFADSGGGDLELLNRIELAALNQDTDALSTLLDTAETVVDVESVVSALDALARLADRAGDRVRAIDLLHRSDQAMEGAPYLINHTERYDAIAVRSSRTQ